MNVIEFRQQFNWNGCNALETELQIKWETMRATAFISYVLEKSWKENKMQWHKFVFAQGTHWRIYD